MRKTWGKMIVIEIASNPKTPNASLVHNTCHFPSALNSHFQTVLNRREKENLNSNIRSHRRAHDAVNERSVKRDVGCEATSGALAVFVPVEDDRESELVAHGRPTILINLKDFHGRNWHFEATIRDRDSAPQAAEYLKILIRNYEVTVLD
jgi:hypothetical protein